MNSRRIRLLLESFAVVLLVATAIFVLPGSSITQSAYNLIENAGSALTKRPTLNFVNGGCADNAGSNRTDCTISGGGGGVNSQTSSYLLVSGDNGKLVQMNGSSLTATLPASPPSSTWNVWIQNLNSSNLTVSPNGLDINTGAGSITLIQYQLIHVWTDGSNYFSQVPLVAGSNVTLSPASSGITVAATGGGGGGALTQISQTVLASPAATVTFSAIPGTYTNLILQVTAAMSDSADQEALQAQFNGDTGADYNFDYMLVSGGGVQGGNGNSQTTMFFGNFPAGLAPASSSGISTVTLNGYASGFTKTVFLQNNGLNATVITGTRQLIMAGDLWNSTAAITAIKLIDAGGGNFVTGSTFTLYGQQ